MRHVLKCVEPYFSDVWSGYKNVEIRFNDRDYKNYDYLTLMLYDKEVGYIDKEITCRINNIRKFEGLKEGYVMLYIDVLGKFDFTS